jgi:hypothetical protein
MIDRAITWLTKNWWGLIVAYGICLGIAFGGVWFVSEPLDLLNNVEGNFLYSRQAIFIILVLMVAAHLALLLELCLRRSRWKKIEAADWESVLLGTWAGNYQHKEKQRHVEVRFEAKNDQLSAHIVTDTQEDKVEQKAVTQGLDRVSFSLLAEHITTSSNRSTKWRPEVWHCQLIYDRSGSPRLSVEITDESKTGDTRKVANPILYRLGK